MSLSSDSFFMPENENETAATEVMARNETLRFGLVLRNGKWIADPQLVSLFTQQFAEALEADDFRKIKPLKAHAAIWLAAYHTDQFRENIAALFLRVATGNIEVPRNMIKEFHMLLKFMGLKGKQLKPTVRGRKKFEGIFFKPAPQLLAHRAKVAQ